jgi:uncharacterized membrane protein
MTTNTKLIDFLKAHWVVICLAVITVIGFVLRIYHLGFQNYFSEEIFTIKMINNSYSRILSDPFLLEGFEQPPLYYILVKISSDLMGGLSLESIRSPSAIFGALCIPAIYALGKKYHSKLTGLIAALIYAISERMIFYSQYSRPYTMVFLFFIITAYCFINLQRKESFHKWMILFTISTILCLCSHYYSIVPLSIFWCILIWQYREKFIPFLAIAAITSIPILLYIKSLILTYSLHPISEIYIKSQYDLTWIDNLTVMPYECFGYLGILLIPACIYYFFTKKDKLTFYFLLVSGITYLSLLVSTFFFNPSARYIVLITPLIIVAAVAPLSTFILSCHEFKQRTALIIGVIYLVIITNIFSLIAWYTTAFHFVFI